MSIHDVVTDSAFAGLAFVSSIVGTRTISFSEAGEIIGDAMSASLACEAAASLVLLATGKGHLNAILKSITLMQDDVQALEWKDQIDELKSLIRLYYEAKARSETYFQFVQTLICNMYSLPAFY